MTLFLGIETSCDECSASVVELIVDSPGNIKCKVLSLSTFSQIDLHRPYGGVVPEVASRNHLETIPHILKQSILEANINFQELTAIAVTNRPGLVGALLVGVTAAKSIAYLENKPLVPVHHLEGHVASVYLDQSQDKMKGLEYPSIVAVISGGHTNLYLAENSPDQWDHTFLNKSLIGSSRDDAAGEAFDKIAKLLGFPYPGGVYIDQQAQGKNAKAFQFPRALKMKDNLEFSFSGLKTAASLEISKLKQLGTLQAQTGDLCASVQEAIVDSIFFKISRAKQIHRCKSVVVVGGVSANTRLRERLKSELEVGSVFFPEMKYCTDNAAMIALAGGLRFMKGYGLTGENMLSLNAQATADV